MDDGASVKIVDQLAVVALLGVPLLQHTEGPAQASTIWKALLGSVFSLVKVYRGRQ